jgi:hypothetical protein
MYTVVTQDFSFFDKDIELQFTMMDEMVLLVAQIAFKQENPDVQLQV